MTQNYNKRYWRDATPVQRLMIVLLDSRSMNGVELIAAERQRQIEQEGFSAEKDDRYTKRQLQSAAICYLVPVLQEIAWPRDWSFLRWKPTPNDRIRELTKAGALIAAEIDRLQRAAKPVDT